MQPIVYDVAVSVDGYISGPSGDISKFDYEGPVVEDYQARMAGYAVAIMGKATYEFGYSFGIKSGDNPYTQMKTIVFSQSINLPWDSDVQVQRTTDAGFIRNLKTTSDGPIYLCGGGAFAGSLLAMGLIDRIFLKRAPLVFGGGVLLFGKNETSNKLQRISTKLYDSGYCLEEYDLVT